ncbi:MAG: hypothetical protein AAFQ02_03890 [Bacteroidota bacterium]
MLSIPIIATDITNLTDARYFAARGVNYLLFDFDQVSLDQVAEFIEWVSGPEWLFLFSENSVEFAEEAIVKFSPAAIASKNDMSQKALSYLSGHVSFFDWSPAEVSINEQRYQTFTEIDNLPEALLINGGDEDAIGMKSYDKLDELFDHIEELS